MSTPKIAALLGVAAMLGVIGSVLLGKLLWADYVLCGICLPRACGCHHDLACARRNLEGFHPIRLEKLCDQTPLAIASAK
jgi:hypothetical protein